MPARTGPVGVPEALRLFLNAGEPRQVPHQRLEFRDALTQEVLDDLSTEVAAMANAEGGVIVFGVREDGQRIGCSAEPSLMSLLAHAIGSCSPQVTARVEVVGADGRGFVLVDVAKGLLHTDAQHRFPIRLARLVDYLDTPGIIKHLQERLGLLFPVEDTAQPEMWHERREPEQEDVEFIIAALSSPRHEVRREGVRELHREIHRSHVLGNAEMRDHLAHILHQDDLEALQDAMAILRYGCATSEAPLVEALRRQMAPLVLRIAQRPRTPQVLGWCLEALEAMRDDRFVDVFVEFALLSSEEAFRQANILEHLGNLWYYGLSRTLRLRLYSELEKCEDERSRARISMILDHLRNTH